VPRTNEFSLSEIVSGLAGPRSVLKLSLLLRLDSELDLLLPRVNDKKKKKLNSR
jgi:hypothetical protein